HKSAVVPHTGRCTTDARAHRFVTTCHPKQKAQRRAAQNGKQATRVAATGRPEGSSKKVKPGETTQDLRRSRRQTLSDIKDQWLAHYGSGRSRRGLRYVPNSHECRNLRTPTRLTACNHCHNKKGSQSEA